MNVATTRQAVEYSLLLMNIVSMQCVTQYSIVIRRISHEEELIQMSRITESNLLGYFEYVTTGTSLSCRLIRNSTRLAQDADGEV